MGKVLDPVADRLLFFTAIVTIIIAGDAPLWFCIAVLVREVVVAVATLVLAALGARRIDVTWFGKAGTFGLMFAFPLFLAGAERQSGGPEFAQAAAWMLRHPRPGLLLLRRLHLRPPGRPGPPRGPGRPGRRPPLALTTRVGRTARSPTACTTGPEDSPVEGAA